MTLEEIICPNCKNILHECRDKYYSHSCDNCGSVFYVYNEDTPSGIIVGYIEEAKRPVTIFTEKEIIYKKQQADLANKKQKAAHVATLLRLAFKANIKLGLICS